MGARFCATRAQKFGALPRRVVILHRKTAKNEMSKRVRITNDSLNSYGTRVLTAGLDLEQYRRNPVLLYMHRRGEVIGYVKDIAAADGEVTGELVFDCASELSERCKRQYEFGSLKMVSVGIDVLEYSDDPANLVEGQTSPTISRSKLFEVSLVDIGANDDAIVLHKDGKQLTLGRDGESPLPLLHNTNPKPQMNQKDIALLLGLSETATAEDIATAVAQLKANEELLAAMCEEREQMQHAAIEALVDEAISAKRLNAEKRAHFVSLGKKVGLEDLRDTLEAMQPQVRLSALVNNTDTANTYTRLGEVPEQEALRLRAEDTAEYKRLYKAEYGTECEI